MDENLDIYEDLDVDEIYQEKHKERENIRISELETEVKKNTENIEKLKKDNERLQKKVKIMETNFNNLFDVVKNEISRKDNQIDALRKEKDNLIFRRKAGQENSNLQENRSNGGNHRRERDDPKKLRDLREDIQESKDKDTVHRNEKDSRKKDERKDSRDDRKDSRDDRKDSRDDRKDARDDRRGERRRSRSRDRKRKRSRSRSPRHHSADRKSRPHHDDNNPEALENPIEKDTELQVQREKILNQLKEEGDYSDSTPSSSFFSSPDKKPPLPIISTISPDGVNMKIENLFGKTPSQNENHVFTAIPLDNIPIDAKLEIEDDSMDYDFKSDKNVEQNNNEPDYSKSSNEVKLSNGVIDDENINEDHKESSKASSDKDLEKPMVTKASRKQIENVSGTTDVTEEDNKSIKTKVSNDKFSLKSGEMVAEKNPSSETENSQRSDALNEIPENNRTEKSPTKSTRKKNLQDYGKSASVSSEKSGKDKGKSKDTYEPVKNEKVIKSSGELDKSTKSKEKLKSQNYESQEKSLTKNRAFRNTEETVCSETSTKSQKSVPYRLIPLDIQEKTKDKKRPRKKESKENTPEDSQEEKVSKDRGGPPNSESQIPSVKERSVRVEKDSHEDKVDKNKTKLQKSESQKPTVKEKSLRMEKDPHEEKSSKDKGRSQKSESQKPPVRENLIESENYSHEEKSSKDKGRSQNSESQKQYVKEKKEQSKERKTRTEKVKGETKPDRKETKLDKGDKASTSKRKGTEELSKDSNKQESISNETLAKKAKQELEDPKTEDRILSNENAEKKPDHEINSESTNKTDPVQLNQVSNAKSTDNEILEDPKSKLESNSDLGVATSPTSRPLEEITTKRRHSEENAHEPPLKQVKTDQDHAHLICNEELFDSSEYIALNQGQKDLKADDEDDAQDRSLNENMRNIFQSPENITDTSLSNNYISETLLKDLEISNITTDTSSFLDTSVSLNNISDPINKRNISTSSKDYIIETVDEYVTNVTIKRKKRKAKPKS